MITSNSCWLKNSCQKYKKPDCECRTADVYCTKLFKLNYLYDMSLISNKQRQPVLFLMNPKDPDWDAFQRLLEVDNNIVDFVDAGNNLYIHSAICGNGKTAWALKLLQSYINKTWIEAPVACNTLFINVPRFLLALKDSISNQNEYCEHIKQNVLKADLVVWDEVATKSLTVYEHEHLLSLINARLDDGKANIYTSNLVPVELEEKLGERLYSRIVNYSLNIEFKSFDKRHATMVAK